MEKLINYLIAKHFVKNGQSYALYSEKANI